MLGQATGRVPRPLPVRWYIGVILVLLPNADVESQRSRILPFALHAPGASSSLSSGLVVQWWCRLQACVDEDDEEDLDELNGYAEDR